MLPAGFTKESVYGGLYLRDESIPCKLVRIQTDEKKVDRAKAILDFLLCPPFSVQVQYHRNDSVQSRNYLSPGSSPILFSVCQRASAGMRYYDRRAGTALTRPSQLDRELRAYRLLKEISRAEGMAEKQGKRRCEYLIDAAQRPESVMDQVMFRIVFKFLQKRKRPCRTGTGTAGPRLTGGFTAWISAAQFPIRKSVPGFRIQIRIIESIFQAHKLLLSQAFRRYLRYRRFRTARNVTEVLPFQMFRQMIVIKKNVFESAAFSGHQKRGGSAVTTEEIAVAFFDGEQTVNSRSELTAHIPVIQRRGEHDDIALFDGRIDFIHIVF